MNPEYERLLNDPHWERKRVKIFKRDGYKCTVCESKRKLECHHTFYYEDYRQPWLYPDDSLLTLCHDCHVNFHLHNEIAVISAPVYKKKNNKMNCNKIKIKHKRQTKFKAGTIYRRVMRKINGEYKEVLRRY